MPVCGSETVRKLVGKAGRAARSTVLFLIMLLAMDLTLTYFAGWEFVASRTGKERLSRIYSPVYHHGLAPNREIPDAQWGLSRYAFATNSLGFKDRRVREVPLRIDQRRILLIGDSFMEGMGYPFDQTAAGMIASRLGEQGVDVLNAGVGSYAPSVYYAKARHLYENTGLRYNDLVVFIDISDIPNEAMNYRLDANENVVPEDAKGISLAAFRARGFVLNFMKDHSMSFMIISHFNRLRLAKREGVGACLEQQIAAGDAPVGSGEAEHIRKRLMGNAPAMWTFDEQVYMEMGKRGLEEAGDSMTRLAAFARERKIPLTLVVYPWPQQIFAGDLDSLQVTYWKDWAHRNGARFINLFPDFVSDEAPMDTYLRYFIPCDEHWNEQGHAFVADRFLKRFSPARPQKGVSGESPPPL